MRALPLPDFIRNPSTGPKHYKPFSTRTPALFIFFVVVILCIVLLQSIAEQGTPIPRASNSTSNSTTHHKRFLHNHSAKAASLAKRVNATTTNSTASTSSIWVPPDCPSVGPTDCSDTNTKRSEPEVSYDTICGAAVYDWTLVLSDIASFDDCATECYQNASCTAFTFTDDAYGNLNYEECCPGDPSCATIWCILSDDLFTYFNLSSTEGFNPDPSAWNSGQMLRSSDPYCTFAAPPTCGATISLGASLPDYDAFCGLWLNNTWNRYSAASTTFDDCAIVCGSDSNCTAFGFWAEDAAYYSDVPCESYFCVLTYDPEPSFIDPTFPMRWGNTQVSNAGRIVSGSRQSGFIASNLTSDGLSTSTCPLPLGPSDCGATRAADGVAPAYEVLCDYVLHDWVFEDDTPKGFDKCAAICLADAN